MAGVFKEGEKRPMKQEKKQEKKQEQVDAYHSMEEQLKNYEKLANPNPNETRPKTVRKNLNRNAKLKGKFMLIKN